MISKFFEVFNNLDNAQLKELEFFNDFPKSKLSKSQKELFKNLIDDKRQHITHNEHSFKKKYWKNKTIADWNKNKTAFQKVIDRFLLTVLHENTFWGNYLLISYFHDHHLEKNFNLLWTKCVKKASEFVSSTSMEKIELYLLYELKTQKKRHDRNPKRKDYLLKSEQNLDAFYALQKLRLACEQLNRQKIIGKSNHTKLDADIIKLLCLKLKDIPEIQLYYNIYRLLLHPKKEEYYNNSFKLIYDFNINFSKDIIIDTVELLMNYCIRNFAQVKYTNHFRIHIEFLEKNNYLLVDSLIDIHSYNNYLAICLIQNDLEKADYVVKKYSRKIFPKELAKHAEALGKLRYYLYMLDIKKCWEIIMKISVDDKTYNFAIDKIYLQLYYFDRDHIGFDHKLRAIRRKLDKEKKLNLVARNNLRHFITVLNKDIKNKEINIENYKSKLSPLDYAWLKKALKTNEQHNLCNIEKIS